MSNIKKIYNINKSVFLRFTARHLKYEFCNSLDWHIQNDFVKFDSVYTELEKKLMKIKILQNVLWHWKDEHKIIKDKKMWRW